MWHLDFFSNFFFLRFFLLQFLAAKAALWWHMEAGLPLDPRNPELPRITPKMKKCPRNFPRKFKKNENPRKVKKIPLKSPIYCDTFVKILHSMAFQDVKIQNFSSTMVKIFCETLVKILHFIAF